MALSVAEQLQRNFVLKQWVPFSNNLKFWILNFLQRIRVESCPLPPAFEWGKIQTQVLGTASHLGWRSRCSSRSAVSCSKLPSHQVVEPVPCWAAEPVLLNRPWNFGGRVSPPPLDSKSAIKIRALVINNAVLVSVLSCLFFLSIPSSSSR